MIRTFRRKASLTAAVHERHEAFLRQQAWLWNHFLAERKRVSKRTKKGVRYAGQQTTLTQLRRKHRKFSQYRLDAQRSAVRRLDRAFKGFFRRCEERKRGELRGKKPGHPRYSRWMRSFDVPKPVIRSLASKYALWGKGIGNLHFQDLPEGRMRQVRVVKTARGVYRHFVMDLPDPPARPLTEPVGLDFGIKQRAVLSTGECFPPVQLDRRELKRKQRVLTRAVKGSKSRAKKKRDYARAWDRSQSRSRNATHRITTRIVRQHNRIAVEDLALRAMLEEGPRCIER